MHSHRLFMHNWKWTSLPVKCMPIKGKGDIVCAVIINIILWAILYMLTCNCKLLVARHRLSHMNISLMLMAYLIPNLIISLCSFRQQIYSVIPTSMLRVLQWALHSVIMEHISTITTSLDHYGMIVEIIRIHLSFQMNSSNFGNLLA